jgi:damage-control phosphatase, subfamily I
MKTYLDCIPCFYQQALKAARISGASEEVQREVLNNLSEIIQRFSLNTTPAEMGRKIYNMISKITGKKDPYREIKEESNKIALRMYPEMKLKLKETDEDKQLITAIKLAIIGNIIDFGIEDMETIQEKIHLMLNQQLNFQGDINKKHFDYSTFHENLLEVDSVLYLADNSGEVVFDRILIEQLVNNYNKNVIYAVKGKPVSNDALVDDAIFCGINQFANIISSGADSPGIILKYCSPEFIRLFNEAEMIISKGQGNYEALSDKENPIFFLLIAKCPLIARHIGCKIGDFVLENALSKKMLPIDVIENKKSSKV